MFRSEYFPNKRERRIQPIPPCRSSGKRKLTWVLQVFMCMPMLHRCPRSRRCVVQVCQCCVAVLVSMSVSIVMVEFGSLAGRQERGGESVLKLDFLRHGMRSLPAVVYVQ